MSNRVTSPTDTSTASIVINELTREHGNAAGVLRLQPSPLESAASSDSRRVTWTEETVDNEHMNKKKSKICCIYHPKEDEDCPHRHDNEPEDPNAWNAYERQPRHAPKPDAPPS